MVSYVVGGTVAFSPEVDEPSWTRGGEPLLYVPFTEDDSSVIARPKIEEAEIPVEGINDPVLLITASDDALWPVRLRHGRHEGAFRGRIRRPGRALELCRLGSRNNARAVVGGPLIPQSRLLS